MHISCQNDSFFNGTYAVNFILLMYIFKNFFPSILPFKFSLTDLQIVRSCQDFATKRYEMLQNLIFF